MASSNAVAADAVREQLKRLLRSPTFSGSKRLQDFLSHAVESALAGKTEQLKEYALGAEVFERGPGFDPRVDTIVRVEARRLRQQLAVYYDGPGRRDPVRIELPKGSYVPFFRAAEGHRGRLARRYLAILAGVVLVLGAAGVVWRSRPVPSARGTAVSKARDAYWEGRYFRGLRGDETAQRRSLDAFERAVAADPNYAEAWSALANSAATLAFHSTSPPDMAVARARKSAAEALRLQPGDPQALGVLGWIDFFYDRDWESAEKRLRRATQASPPFATAHQWYAFGLAAHLRFEEALQETRMAVDLEPGYAATTDLSMILYLAGRFSESAEASAAVLKLQPRFELAHLLRGMCAAAQGNHRQALTEYAQSGLPVPGRRGYSLAAAGRRWEAIELLDGLRGRPVPGQDSAHQAALIEVALGQFQAALTSLERGADARESDVLFLRAEPAFVPLRSQPRFRALCARLGLPR